MALVRFNKSQSDSIRIQVSVRLVAGTSALEDRKPACPPGKRSELRFESEVQADSPRQRLPRRG